MLTGRHTGRGVSDQGNDGADNDQVAEEATNMFLQQQDTARGASKSTARSDKTCTHAAAVRGTAGSEDADEDDVQAHG